MQWILLLCALVSTTSPSTAPTNRSASVLVVTGAQGTPEYGRDFAKWADHWRDAANTSSVTFLEVGRTPTAGQPDKQRLRELLASESKSRQPLWLILIGHGTFDGHDAKFNLRDDDISAQELSELLQDVKRPTAVVCCFSASSPFLNALSAPDRIVITATRSGSEHQFSRFGDFLSASIADASADLDKDGQTSLLEAFLAASHRTEEFYKQESRLATEHALLDDNGDKLGIPADWFQGIRATRSAKEGAALDGLRAHQWHLVESAGDRSFSAKAREQRDELEFQIEALRQKKAALNEKDYYAQLEKLLIQLSRLYAESPASTRPAPSVK